MGGSDSKLLTEIFEPDKEKVTSKRRNFTVLVCACVGVILKLLNKLTDYQKLIHYVTPVGVTRAQLI